MNGCDIIGSALLKKERSQKWDILKLFLIFTVVLGHAADNYTSISEHYEHMRSLFFFIYIFHMPLFIFVSGLFAKKSIDQKRFDKMAGYLIVYVFLKIFVYLVKISAGKNPDFELLSESGAPWFMLALFFFSIITVIIRKVPKILVIVLSIILGCASGYFVNDGDFLAYSRVFVFYPFFYLGYILDPKKLENQCESIFKKVIAFVIFVASGIFVLVQGDKVYWLRYLLTGRNPYSVSLTDSNPCKYDLPPEFETYGFLFRLGYYALVIILCACIIVIIPKKTPFGICAKLGQRTLSVYGLHFGILYYLYDVLDIKPFFEELIPWHNEFIVFPIAIVTTLLLSLNIFYIPINFLMNVPCKITEKIRKIKS